MSELSDSRVLVLGGAGFLGSHIARRLSEAGAGVTVIDGLLPRTGGRADHLSQLRTPIRFLRTPIAEIPNLEHLVAGSDAVIDCMAWTSHHLALEDPLYDLKLNLESHLSLLRNVPDDYPGQLVYLGTRSQYGSAAVTDIDEDTPMTPADVQGVHKLAAESHFRIYSAARRLSVRSLRLPNCFGENQKVEGDDIGLVGSFVRDLLLNREVEVYGTGRRRTLAYGPDVADLVLRLLRRPGRGFEPYNVGGHELEILDLANQLARIVGRGKIVARPLPAEIARMDVGDAVYKTEKLDALAQDFRPTELTLALQRTVAFFAHRLDLAWEPRE